MLVKLSPCVYFADGIYTLTASLENDNNKYDSEEDGNITIQISIEGHFISMTGISNFGIEFSLTPVEETVQLPNIFDLAPAFKSRINRQGDLTWLKTIK